jgi:hypothetical protein
LRKRTNWAALLAFRKSQAASVSFCLESAYPCLLSLVASRWTIQS